MKYKYIFAFFLVGALLLLLGMWSKITHQSYAAMLIDVAFTVLSLAIVITIIKLISTKNKDNILNQ